jgi:predicted O-methyltransferase YrrM
MPEPTVLGILGTIILMLTGALLAVGRMMYTGKLRPESQYLEAVARAERYEDLLMQSLGVTEALVPMMEQQAQVVQTVGEALATGGDQQ